VNYTNIDVAVAAKKLVADGDNAAQYLASLRSARYRRLANITADKFAAHEMSCAIGDLLRFLGVDDE
jgi:hypothetical protein